MARFLIGTIPLVMGTRSINLRKIYEAIKNRQKMMKIMDFMAHFGPEKNLTG